MNKIEDEHGNIIERNNNTLFLKLKGEKRKRKLGVIHPELRTIDIIRQGDKHLHKKTQSYGFNHYILENATTFDKVYLTDESGIYVIPIKEILAKGIFIHYEKQGFEKQIFYEIKHLSKWNANQKSLF